MLDIITRLHKYVDKHKDCKKYNSIFNEISDVYFYENYHSDIIAYYLKFEYVKEVFIQWLNNFKKKDNRKIIFNEYCNGEVKREKNKIDILLYSNDATKAIIIENKSNNAVDQFNQVYRYYNELQHKEKINVEAIFYLNKDSNKSPDLSSLSNEHKKILNDILVVSKLIGENSFVDKVINNVIANTKNIRLNGLSQEISDFLYYIIYGELNMEKMEEFVLELKVPGNLEKLKEVMRAYDEIPKY